MAIFTSPNIITITAAGGEEPMPLGGPDRATILSGSATLSDDFTLTPPDAAQVGDLFEIYYLAEIELGGNDLNIFGTLLTEQQALFPCKISALRTASAWNVIIHSNLAAPTGVHYLSDSVRFRVSGDSILIEKTVDSGANWTTSSVIDL